MASMTIPCAASPSSACTSLCCAALPRRAKSSPARASREQVVLDFGDPMELSPQHQLSCIYGLVINLLPGSQMIRGAYQTYKGRAGACCARITLGQPTAHSPPTPPGDACLVWPLAALRTVDGTTRLVNAFVMILWLAIAMCATHCAPDGAPRHGSNVRSLCVRHTASSGTKSAASLWT